MAQQPSKPASEAPSQVADFPDPSEESVIDDQAGSEDTRTSGADRGQVTLGLAGKADDPRTARPLDHPESLPGEKPARGDNSRPG